MKLHPTINPKRFSIGSIVAFGTNFAYDANLGLVVQVSSMDEDALYECELVPAKHGEAFSVTFSCPVNGDGYSRKYREILSQEGHHLGSFPLEHM